MRNFVRCSCFSISLITIFPPQLLPQTGGAGTKAFSFRFFRYKKKALLSSLSLVCNSSLRFWATVEVFFSLSQTTILIFWPRVVGCENFQGDEDGTGRAGGENSKLPRKQHVSRYRNFIILKWKRHESSRDSRGNWKKSSRTPKWEFIRYAWAHERNEKNYFQILNFPINMWLGQTLSWI